MKYMVRMLNRKMNTKRECEDRRQKSVSVEIVSQMKLVMLRNVDENKKTQKQVHDEEYDQCELRLQHRKDKIENEKYHLIRVQRI